MAICEDFLPDAENLRKKVMHYCGEKQVNAKIDIFKKSEEFREAYQPGRFQIIFFDIFINTTDRPDGMILAREVRKTDRKCKMIFTTLSRDYAVESYEVEASFYLLKPISYISLSTALDRCRHLFLKEMNCIKIISNYSLFKILIKDIIYAEACNKKIIIHTVRGNIETYTNLNQIEKLLHPAENGSPQPFIRCHRAFIVNMDFIRRPLENEFLLKNGEKVLIKSRHSKTIKNLYAHYLAEKMQTEL